MKKVVQDLTSGGIDWQREKWQSGLGSKFIHQGEKNAVKYADEVIVLSKGVQDYFKKTYDRETHFIPNGVNRPQIREAKLITDKFGLKKDSYILFLGRLVPEKGIRYLVEAFKNTIAQNCTPNQINKNNLRLNQLSRTKEAYGRYRNVFLEDYSELEMEIAELDTLIEDLSAYMQSTGRKYADHAATLRSWSARKKRQQKPGAGIPDYTYNKEESL